MVVHACHPSSAEGISRRKIKVKGQPQAKARPYLKNKVKSKKGWGFFLGRQVEACLESSRP
jgi:hypothetical protein